jgi:tetratricopeptide (TPR) repeat protein
MHFDLVRLFAEQYTVNPNADGIPYAKDFSLNTPEFESLEKNYEHILADLHEAERLLADEAKYVNTSVFMTDRQIHCNLYAVQALLARVYLTRGDKAKAAEYAKKVIDHSPYRLNDKTEIDGDLAGVLSRNETLFGIYFAEFYTNVYNKLEATQSFSSLNPRDDIEDIYAFEEQGVDLRKSSYLKTIDRAGTPTLRLSKLTDIYELKGNVAERPKDRILGINLIRIPEMYYIMAEALLEATDTIGATTYFDCVLQSRGLTPLEARTPTDTVTQVRINQERFKEYIGEGQTFYNMKRQYLPIDAWDKATNSTKTFAADKSIYVIPIPDSEYANRY